MLSIVLLTKNGQFPSVQTQRMYVGILYSFFAGRRGCSGWGLSSFSVLCNMPGAVQRAGKCSGWGQFLHFRDRGWQCSCIQRMCQNPAVVLQPHSRGKRKNLVACQCWLHWLAIRSAQEQEVASTPEELLSFSPEDWYLGTQLLGKHRPSTTLEHQWVAEGASWWVSSGCFNSLSVSYLE